MNKLAKLAFQVERVDTTEIEELPMAIKYGTAVHYQPIIDKTRQHLSEINQATSEGASVDPKIKDMRDLSGTLLEDIRGISEKDLQEVEHISKKAAALIRNAPVVARDVVVDNQRDFNSHGYAEALLKEAFEVVTCAKTNKEVLELGKNTEAQRIVNATVRIAAKMTDIDSYAVKDGYVLKDNMRGDDIKFANLVLGRLSSTLNGSIIPSAKKVGMLEAAKRELENVTEESDRELISDVETFCPDRLSRDYGLAISESTDIAKMCKKLVGVMKLTSIPRDMIYNHTNEHNKEAISSLKTLINDMDLIENRAAFLQPIQRDLEDIFSEHELGSVPIDQKVHDPQETDWYLRHADEGTEAYDALKIQAESVQYDQVELEETLARSSKILQQDLMNELRLAKESLTKELYLHKDAIKNNEYSM